MLRTKIWGSIQLKHSHEGPCKSTSWKKVSSTPVKLELLGNWMQLNHNEKYILNIKSKNTSLHDSQLKQTVDVAEFSRKGASQVWILRQCSATTKPNHASKNSGHKKI